CAAQCQVGALPLQTTDQARVRAPAAFWLTASPVHALSRSRATRARGSFHPSARRQPTPAAIPLQPKHKSTARAQLRLPPAPLENSAQRSGCTCLFRKPTARGPSNSSAHAASPPLLTPALNCKRQ